MKFLVISDTHGKTEIVQEIYNKIGDIDSKMGHSERKGANICKNVPGEKDQHTLAFNRPYFNSRAFFDVCYGERI